MKRIYPYNVDCIDDSLQAPCRDLLSAPFRIPTDLILTKPPEIENNLFLSTERLSMFSFKQRILFVLPKFLKLSSPKYCTFVFNVFTVVFSLLCKNNLSGYFSLSLIDILSLYVCLFDCVGSQLHHAGSFVVARGLSSCDVQVPSLQHAGPLVARHGLWSAWAQLLCSMWDLSSPMRD